MLWRAVCACVGAWYKYVCFVGRREIPALVPALVMLRRKGRHPVCEPGLNRRVHKPRGTPYLDSGTGWWYVALVTGIGCLKEGAKGREDGMNKVQEK